MNLKVVIEEDEETGGYIVCCPALPGCFSQGDTTDEALENIKEAIQACLESLAETQGIKTGFIETFNQSCRINC